MSNVVKLTQVTMSIGSPDSTRCVSCFMRRSIYCSITLCCSTRAASLTSMIILLGTDKTHSITRKDEVGIFGKLCFARLVTVDLRPADASIHGYMIRTDSNNGTVLSMKLSCLSKPSTYNVTLPLCKETCNGMDFATWDLGERMEIESINNNSRNGNNKLNGSERKFSRPSIAVAEPTVVTQRMRPTSTFGVSRWICAISLCEYLLMSNESMMLF